MLSAHDLVTVVLVYLAIGSLVWLAVWCSGAVHDSYRKHPDGPGIVIASVGVVVLWPYVAAMFGIGLVHGWRQGARR